MPKIALFLAVFSLSFASVSAFTVPDAPEGYVNDYANMLSGDTKKSLEQQLTGFTASTSNEIAVVTVPDLGGDTVEHYATKLFESWKIGKDKHDNGVLLLISKSDHKLRIEVGYGLEGALPDILAKDIINNQITPSFKNEQYNLGILKGVLAIEQATQNEYVISSPSTPSSHTSVEVPSFFTIFIIIIVAFQFLSAIFARSKSWWAGGVVGGFLGGAFTFFHIFGATLLVGGSVTVILIIIGLVFDYIVSNTYTSSISSGGGIPWWIGGRGFGGGGSGSSFGGFGGGSSGGGGASGSW